MTLAGRPPAVISAPSKTIMLRTCAVLPSLAISALVSPAGATTSRSGRMIRRNAVLSRARSAAPVTAAVP